jgi:hypothetical protein
VRARWHRRLPAWSPAAFAAAAAVALIGLGLVLMLVLPRDFYTGTNSVRTRAMMLKVPGHSTLCIPDLRIPGGTGRIEFEISTLLKEQPPISFVLQIAGQEHRSAVPAGQIVGGGKLRFAFPRTPDEPASQIASACLTTEGANAISFGGVPGLIEGDQLPVLNGKQTGLLRLSTWYLPPEGERHSIISQLPKIFEREALFKPSWVGAWTYWVLFFVVLPALIGLALWVLLSADRRRRLPLLVALLTFANAAAWAHITPAFQAPDESEHFAYVESLAERGKPLSSVTVPDPHDPYSDDQNFALEATRIFSSNETDDGRPPWLKDYQDAYEQRVARDHPRRDNGGGFAVAASAHSPLYYALLVPAYAVGTSGGVFDELTLMRLVSGLLGAIVAACAVLLVLEFLPRRRLVAAAAGLLVGFQPMFGFMSGTVNNDMGVNAAAAAVILLLVRTLRRGFRPWQSAALGAALVVMPLMKGTGYGLYPAALIGLVLAAWRWRHAWRKHLPGVAALVASFAAAYIAWSLAAGSLDRSSFTTPGGQVPGEGFGALSNIPDALSYLWQVFLPRLPFMTDHWTLTWPAVDIYAKRGWGAFGWYAISWPDALYTVIMLGMVGIAGLGVAALVRWRAWTRRNLFEILFLLAAVGGVIGTIHFAYYTPGDHGPEHFPEQGRYLFPTITILATMGVGAMFALGRRAAEPAVAGLAAGVVAFGYASMWLVLAGFYYLVLF